MTDGGLGVAFFCPVRQHALLFPWTPVRVAPIGLFRFFSMRGLSVFAMSSFGFGFRLDCWQRRAGSHGSKV
jgi:hypothetical protein